MSTWDTLLVLLSFMVSLVAFAGWWLWWLTRRDLVDAHRELDRFKRQWDEIDEGLESLREQAAKRGPVAVTVPPSLQVRVIGRYPRRVQRAAEKRSGRL
jgi:hypothetical protein